MRSLFPKMERFLEKPNNVYYLFNLSTEQPNGHILLFFVLKVRLG
jgi:hypothetical protein